MSVYCLECFPWGSHCFLGMSLTLLTMTSILFPQPQITTTLNPISSSIQRGSREADKAML